MKAPERFKKKPTIVYAIEWTGENLKEVIDFTGLHSSAKKWTWDEYKTVVQSEGLKIFTQEGPLMAAVGDYIVRGHTERLGDHFWPVKPDYFMSNYETFESPFSEFDKLRDDALGR